MFFKKKKKTKNQDSVSYTFRIEPYGKELEEYIVFCSIDNEEIQKRERVWLSAQVLESFTQDYKNIANFNNQLNKTLDDYIIDKAVEIIDDL